MSITLAILLNILFTIPDQKKIDVHLRGDLSKDIYRASGSGKPTQTQLLGQKKGVGKTTPTSITDANTHSFPMTQTPMIQNSIQTPVTLNVMVSAKYGVNAAS